MMLSLYAISLWKATYFDGQDLAIDQDKRICESEKPDRFDCDQQARMLL